MLTNEEYSNVINYINQTYTNKSLFEGQTITKDVVEFCVDDYNKIKYGKTLPIQWVSDLNDKCTEFYYSKDNLGWLLTTIGYYKNTEYYSEDFHEITMRCVDIAAVLLFVDGINTIDGVTYLLKRDINFMDKSQFKHKFI